MRDHNNNNYDDDDIEPLVRSDTMYKYGGGDWRWKRVFTKMAGAKYILEYIYL